MPYRPSVIDIQQLARMVKAGRTHCVRCFHKFKVGDTRAIKCCGRAGKAAKNSSKHPHCLECAKKLNMI